MRVLGFDRFQVVGHDRGGRVAHRMALDHSTRVTRLAVLDIVPTLTTFESVDQALATAYYHWFFLIQPHPLPEHMIGLDAEFYLRRQMDKWGVGTAHFTQEAMAEYIRCFRNPAAIHAMCEDYRAAASSTWSMTGPTAPPASSIVPAAGAVGWPSDHGPQLSTCWRHGGRWRWRLAGTRWTAAITSRRSGRTNSPRHCWISWSVDAIPPETERP